MNKISRIVSLFAAAVIGSAGLCAAQDKPKVVTEDLKIPNSPAKFEMVQIPAGKVTFKSKDGKETTAEIKSIWMGKLEAGWDEYDIFWQRLDLTPDEVQKGVDADNRPSKPYSPPDRGFGRQNWPCGSTTFAEAQKYCKWLSKKTGKKYRLPTQAEWIYACKAGGAGEKLKGDALKEVAWYEANSEEKTQKQGSKKPNAWGLHDMLGNVAEWTTLEDGQGIAMGGSFQDEAAEIHCEAGYKYDPSWQKDDPQDPKGKSWLSNGAHIGIRVVCEDTPGAGK